MKYKKSREAKRLESNGDGGGSRKGGGGDVPPSIQLEIMEPRAAGTGGGGGLGTGGRRSSLGVLLQFEPWRERTPGSASTHGSSGSDSGREPPEKRLTLFALRLAVLEKAASGFGKLDFVWATVVLLGGFASSLRITDFWCVTVILVGEGARVFGRRHELEWQQHATQTSTAGGGVSDEDARARAALFQRQIVAFMRQRAGRVAAPLHRLGLRVQEDRQAPQLAAGALRARLRRALGDAPLEARLRPPRRRQPPQHEAGAPALVHAGARGGVALPL